MVDQIERNLQNAETLAAKATSKMEEVQRILQEASSKCEAAIHDNCNARQFIANSLQILDRVKKHPGGTACCIMGLAFVGFKIALPGHQETCPSPFTAMQERDYERAIVGFNTILKQDGQTVTILGEHSYCCYQLGKYQEALTDTEQMLRLNHSSGRAYFLKGLINKKLGNLEVALDCFRIAAHHGDPLAVYQIRSTENISSGRSGR